MLSAPNIIACAHKRKSSATSPEVSSTLSKFLSYLDGPGATADTQVIVSFLVLPYLMNTLPNSGSDSGNKTSKKNERSSNKSQKPSKCEVSDSFITHIRLEGDLDTTLNSKRELLLKRGLTLQPLIFIVGEHVCNPEQIYVVDNIKYQFTDLTTAVDATFKIFQAANLKYPLDAHHVWLVIQQGFYGLKIKGDKLNQSSRGLLADLDLLNESPIN